MLEDLRVLNGDLSPKYDKYNNRYTVKISSDVERLDFIFKEDDYNEIYVYGNNNLKEGENKIIISITKDKETNYIYITAIKEETKEMMVIDSYQSSVETTNSMPVYGGLLIAISCFMLILIVFAILFGKRKKI